MRLEFCSNGVDHMNQQGAIDAQIARMLEKIAQVQARARNEPDPDRALVLSRRLSAPLSEQAIRAFELAEGIQLPADYRTFLLTAGNGGGPIGISGGSYPAWQVALWPLERWYAAAYRDPPSAGFLSAPSPLKPMREGDDEVWEREEGPGSHWFRGAIVLCEEGCGWYSLLVVSGPFRGRVASTDGGYNEPHVTNLSFLDWYEHSLDRVLR
jgi:hypothetical protein